MTIINVDTDGTSGDYEHLEDALPASLTDDVEIICKASTGVSDELTSILSIPDEYCTSYSLTISQGDDDYLLEIPATYSIAIDGDNSQGIELSINIEKTSITANYQQILGYGNCRNASLTISGIWKFAFNTSYRARVFTISPNAALTQNITLENLVVWNVSGNSNSVANAIIRNATAAGAGSTLKIYNCTFSGASRSLYSNVGDWDIVNTVLISDDGIGGTLSDDSDYNATNHSTGLSGSNDRLSQTFSWENAATGDFRPDSDDVAVRDYGIGPSSDANVPTTDADGETRSGTTCDIGAYEYVSAGGTAYSITAESGTFTETGTAAALLKGYAIDAETGSFTESGTDAGLLHGFAIDAETGAFTETGADATLLKSYTIEADAGSFTETGTAAGLYQGFAIDADSGTFILTGQDAALQYGANTSITAEAGAYTLTGSGAGLLKGYTLDAEAGTLVFTGSDATLTYAEANSIDAEAGTFTATGTAADLLKTWKLTAEAGSFIETGTDAALNYGLALNAETGAFTETGTAAALLKGWLISAEAGAIAYTGNDVTLTYAAEFIPIDRRDLSASVTLRRTVTAAMLQSKTVTSQVTQRYDMEATIGG